jgi:hypothetical protein
LTLLKSIVVCLVLANVGYFLWAGGIATTSQAPTQPAPAATLRLASESAEAPRAATAGAVSPTPGGAAAIGRSEGQDAPRADAGSTNPKLLTNVKRCISVGPFRDVSEAARAAATLRGGGYDPRQRVADGEVWAGVWVYLPLPVSRSTGDQMLAKLKAGGIDDALEMPGPNEGSVISLVAQAQALGFNPGIADRKRTGNVYWIDIDLKPTDSLLNPADLQGDSGHILRLEVKGCPSDSGTSP